MRLAGIVLLSLALAGAAAAAPARRAPLALGGMLESWGAPDLGSGSAPGDEPGEQLRFIPHGRLAVGVLLENKSAKRLVVTGAEVLEPHRTLIRQVGAHFHVWNPPKCPPGAFCPAHVFKLNREPGGPRPFSIRPRKNIGVELDFRLGGCAAIPHANPAPISRLRFTFRSPDGATRHRVLLLGGAELHLRMPESEDCAQPRSSLNIQGPQRYDTSYYWTEPGSRGDVCAIEKQTLSFESRVYQAGNVLRPVRIEIRLVHFSGTGAYRAVVSGVVRGRQVVVFRRGRVTVTRATSRRVVAKVATSERPAPDGKGVPFRIFGTMRCRVVRG